MKAVVISIWILIFLGTTVLWRAIILKTQAFLSIDKITEPLALLLLGSGSILFSYLVRKGLKNRKHSKD